MRLLALLGLVALVLANPVPVDHLENLCRVITNTALDRTNKEAIYDALFPAMKTFCDSLGVEISRAVLEERTWRMVSQGNIKSYDECIDTPPGIDLSRQCKKYQ